MRIVIDQEKEFANFPFCACFETLVQTLSV